MSLELASYINIKQESNCKKVGSFSNENLAPGIRGMLGILLLVCLIAINEGKRDGAPICGKLCVFFKAIKESYP
jgi:hypothetical protein